MIPDLIEPIVAWRVWRVGPTGSLESVGLPVPWPEAGPLVAACPFGPYLSSSHPAPVWSCSCGLYAAKRPELLAGALVRGQDLALGLVCLWGRVLEAPRGYRAERAAVRALVAPADPDGRISRAGERYDVPAMIGPKALEAL